jgi:uncharacterized protein YijF (DUF1287 family)
MKLPRPRRRWLLLALLLLCGLSGVLVRKGYVPIALDYFLPPPAWQRSVELIKCPRTPADRIVNGAKNEVLRGVRYDAAYVQIGYPGGDVPRDRGSCSDVVVRALRNAGYDLQQLIHEDKAASPGSYPHYSNTNGPDPNIDHRRIPNQKAFLRRHGLELPTSTSRSARGSWKPGDIVYWRLGFGGNHCGVLSNDRNADGLPLVIHNLGGARQQDCLDAWQITGHFRYPAGAAK